MDAPIVRVVGADAGFRAFGYWDDVVDVGSWCVAHDALVEVAGKDELAVPRLPRHSFDR